MPSLLVADDTPIIRSTIAHMVAREKPGFNSVIEASNGEEAVELARQTKPDIVLMDIKMPGLDGLQATAVIRAELPATKIIILTAYDEFPYVQKALKLGVVDYLLKPVRSAKLTEVLTEVYDQIQTERQQLQEEEKTKVLLQNTLPVVEASLVDRLVRGLTTDKGGIETSLKYLGKIISWPAVIVADVDNFEAMGADISLSTLTEITSKLIGETKTFLVGYSAPQRVIVIVSTDPYQIAADQLRHLGIILQQGLATKLGHSVSVGVGHHYPDLESIPLSYAEASLACRHNICQVHQRVIHINDIDDINCRDKLAYPVQLERKILDSVQAGEIKTCTTLLNEMLDYLIYQFKEKPGIIRNRLSELIALVARTVIGAGASDVDVLELSHQQVVALSSMQDKADMRAWALNSLTELIAAIPTFLPPDGDVVQHAIDYIQQHQHQPDITLNDVAHAVNLSASHMAYLLKERVGVSYKNYLTTLRLESAKKLLRTTNLTINSIAEAVGYQNTTNFYRLFQRETGLTPAAYRRLA